MRIKSTLIVSLVVVSISFAPSLAADSSGTKSTPPMQAIAAAIKKVVFSPSTPAPVKSTIPEQVVEEQDALIFTAPPRETEEVAKETYQPVAAYLSQVTGKKIRYKYPGTWGVYRTEMLKGGYDIIFDGPHFNSYRMDKLSHNILVKIPERHEFVVIVKKDGIPFQNIQQMAGRTFCTHAPPNLGTLVLLNQFDNPSRQPVIINTKGWDKIYEGVVAGKCVGGILPALNLKKFDKAGLARVVYKAKAMPNQAFSAGPRVSLEDQAKIAQALASPDASGPTEKLRATYKVGESFALANNEEYKGLAEFLRNEWGYY
ncbi:MAG: phosphate/phosphite/phosphonate ABC transporter substrate-binding protein [Gammaproteobacteria bacterium]|nr:phosphate/phosphite/phosphonate ABC transporter substrate-binding protein [Gammaproteobacteria bacterium]